MTTSVFARIRAASAEVVRRARHVRIAEPALDALADRLAREPAPPAALDPARHAVGDERTTLAHVLVLDALNFGSGWFPLLHKPPGLSGYFTVATALERRFQSRGAFTAAELRALETADVTELFGQEGAPPAVGELMERFRQALNELGSFLLERYAGRFEGPVEEAAGRAERLVACLAEMPFYRDVARYDELEIPFYKRAQITAADLAAAFGGCGWGRFEDLDDLTLFADNLVPHVLRCEGALVYTSELARAIDAGELLPAGAAAEVEIRASAVHAVEDLVARLRARGCRTTARQLDCVLWNRGQRPEIKARPRHRTRCVYY